MIRQIKVCQYFCSHWFRPVSLIACLQSGDRHWRKVAATFEKAELANSLSFVVHIYMGAYFCMGAYKRDLVVVNGCLYS